MPSSVGPRCALRSLHQALERQGRGRYRGLSGRLVVQRYGGLLSSVLGADCRMMKPSNVARRVRPKAAPLPGSGRRQASPGRKREAAITLQAVQRSARRSQSLERKRQAALRLQATFAE